MELHIRICMAYTTLYSPGVHPMVYVTNLLASRNLLYSEQKAFCGGHQTFVARKSASMDNNPNFNCVFNEIWISNSLPDSNPNFLHVIQIH